MPRPEGDTGCNENCIEESSVRARDRGIASPAWTDSKRVDDVNAEVPVRDGLLVRVGRRRFARVRLNA